MKNSSIPPKDETQTPEEIKNTLPNELQLLIFSKSSSSMLGNLRGNNACYINAMQLIFSRDNLEKTLIKLLKKWLRHWELYNKEIFSLWTEENRLFWISKLTEGMFKYNSSFEFTFLCQHVLMKLLNENDDLWRKFAHNSTTYFSKLVHDVTIVDNVRVFEGYLSDEMIAEAINGITPGFIINHSIMRSRYSNSFCRNSLKLICGAERLKREQVDIILPVLYEVLALPYRDQFDVNMIMKIQALKILAAMSCHYSQTDAENIITVLVKNREVIERAGVFFLKIFYRVSSLLSMDKVHPLIISLKNVFMTGGGDDERSNKVYFECEYYRHCKEGELNFHLSHLIDRMNDPEDDEVEINRAFSALGPRLNKKQILKSKEALIKTCIPSIKYVINYFTEDEFKSVLPVLAERIKFEIHMIHSLDYREAFLALLNACPVNHLEQCYAHIQSFIEKCDESQTNIPIYNKFMTRLMIMDSFEVLFSRGSDCQIEGFSEGFLFFIKRNPEKLHYKTLMRSSSKMFARMDEPKIFQIFTDLKNSIQSADPLQKDSSINLLTKIASGVPTIYQDDFFKFLKGLYDADPNKYPDHERYLLINGLCTLSKPLGKNVFETIFTEPIIGTWMSAENIYECMRIFNVHHICLSPNESTTLIILILSKTRLEDSVGAESLLFEAELILNHAKNCDKSVLKLLFTTVLEFLPKRELYGRHQGIGLHFLKSLIPYVDDDFLFEISHLHQDNVSLEYGITLSLSIIARTYAKTRCLKLDESVNVETKSTTCSVI